MMLCKQICAKNFSFQDNEAIEFFSESNALMWAVSALKRNRNTKMGPITHSILSFIEIVKINTGIRKCR